MNTGDLARVQTGCEQVSDKFHLVPAPARQRQGPAQNRYRSNRAVTLLETIAVLVVTAAFIALVVWFLFFSHGAAGPGTL